MPQDYLETTKNVYKESEENIKLGSCKFLEIFMDRDVEGDLIYIKDLLL